MKAIFLFTFLNATVAYCISTAKHDVNWSIQFKNTDRNAIPAAYFLNDTTALEKLNNWKKMLTSQDSQARLNSLKEANYFLDSITVSEQVHRSFFDFFLTGVEDQDDYVRSRAIDYVRFNAKSSDFNEDTEEHLAFLIKNRRKFVDRLFLLCAKYNVEATNNMIRAVFREHSRRQIFNAKRVTGEDPDWVVWNAASSLVKWGDQEAMQFVLSVSNRLMLDNRSFVLKTLAKRLLATRSKPLGMFVINEFIYSDYCDKGGVLNCEYEVASFMLLYPTIVEFKAFVDSYFAKSQTPSKAQIQAWFREHQDDWSFLAE